MEIKKIDITSTAIEKGLDLAKSFLGKLISPAVDEVGLLIASPIKMWRLEREIKMLNRTNEICEKYKIKPKQVNLKLLAPLIEFSSLEEDDDMLDKWSILLSNLADSEQNIENHVLPYLLSQISKDELHKLEYMCRDYLKSKNELNKKTKIFIELNPSLEKDFKILSIAGGYLSIEKGKTSKINLDETSKSVLSDITHLEIKTGWEIEVDINQLTIIEIENLKRLAILEIDKDWKVDEKHNPFRKDNKIILQPKCKYYITELGKTFISSCNEKQSIQ